MKKFLSLVLALVMTMSLVTVSAGAKDFGDSADLSGEAYEEAVNVMSEMGIIDGYAEGDFRPQGTLTRQAAAKIIACMMLGKTTAESLGTSAAPFKDVPAGSKFAGYIAFCVERGLIDGYGDGTFRPTNTLTGFAFLKMLLGALGYDSDIEGYTGTNWTVNVAGRAYEIGLTDGNDNFVGSQACTREQAALYAVNTLKSTLVEYKDKGSSVTINGAEIVTGASEPTYVTSSIYNQATSINADKDNASGDYTVEFAERYQPDLKLTPDTDDFMRPSHTWSWKNREVGTYMNHDELVAEYTTAVTGSELYDVLTATTIREYDLYAYVDALENVGGKNTNAEMVKRNLTRSNDEDLNGTGTGVLTQVFVNNEDEEIVITSINTYLAQATADYSESREYAPVAVYVKDGKQSPVYNVDVEEVAAVEGVEEDGWYLVNISYKYNETSGEVVELMDAEVLEDSTVTKFTRKNNDDDNDTVNNVSKLTTGGTQYNAAAKAFYDPEVLNKYNADLLTDATYNVYLDQYGNFIGVDLYSGADNYVFITGYDLNRSNLTVTTADAGAIFLDGTMRQIEVDVKDTNKNIDKVDNKEGTKGYFTEWKSYNDGGKFDENRWYTYTVDEDGVYTLKPAVRMTMTQYNTGDVIDTANVDVVDSWLTNERVYGEDETVFITVDEDVVDTTNNKEYAISEVTGVYTGVQSVDLEIEASNYPAGCEVYAVYDSDYYIIGAIVFGEAQGSTANIAYIVSNSLSEEYVNGTYYWEFDVVMGGELQTVTAKSKYSSTIDVVEDEISGRGDRIVELRFDGDYVVSIKGVDDIYGNRELADDTVSVKGYDVYDVSDNDFALSLKGRTMYVTEDRSDVGLALVSDAKAVVIQLENGKTVKTEFTSVSGAIGRLAEPKGEEDTPNQQYDGRIIAVLNTNGAAEWVVFINDSELVTGTNRPSQDENNGDVRYVSIDEVLGTITLNEDDKPTTTGGWTADEKNAVEAAARLALNSIGYRATGSVTWGNGSSADTIEAVDMDSSNPARITFRIIWG